jgi:hypothetical protein
MIAAHRQRWAVVGPVMINANGESMISWADTFLAFSRYLEPTTGRVIEDLPGRNSSYKREVLLSYGDKLEHMLEMETLLHNDLRSRGYELYLEPAAKTYHKNFTNLRLFIEEQFCIGRVFAATRAKYWPGYKRILYAGGSVLVPWIRLRRILRDVYQPGRPHHLIPRVLPALLVGLVVAAVGEMMGYSFGPADSTQRLGELEFHR